MGFMFFYYLPDSNISQLSVLNTRSLVYIYYFSILNKTIEMGKLLNVSLLIGFIVLLTGCNDNKSAKVDQNNKVEKHIPEWTKKAIWYQIFVERFRNGDKTNDPTIDDIKGFSFDKSPDNWKTTSWSHDWYKQDKWEENTGKDFYYTAQWRRYGGDLQGVIDKLDYLQELGVTALFFNPINDSPSLHKYDSRNYRHIDRNFGPDPKGDKKIIDSEDPSDPSTWKFTATDKLFLQLIKEVHNRGMRIIIDYSWNHTGVTFWAWEDVLKNQEKSEYADWYMINKFNDTKTEVNEFDYDGWANVETLPELKKISVKDRKHGYPYEGNIAKGPKQHIFNVTKRWLDPYNNGDLSSGIDGYRLDVADQIPMQFWRDWKKFVKSINPNAYLVGEIWWAEWPDKLMDPLPYLQGDVFDATMHYQWFKPARQLFANADSGYKISEFVAVLNNIYKGYDAETPYIQMNMASGHDSPRLSTSIANNNKYKYQSKPTEGDNYFVFNPDKENWNKVKLFLIHQYTFIGAPHIWNGDEMGMWGADDPDERKPLTWDDLKFDDEEYNYKQEKLERNYKVEFNSELFSFYKKLIKIRKRNEELSLGDIKFEIVEDDNKVLVYSRTFNNKTIYVAFNLSDKEQIVNLDFKSEYLDLITDKKFSSEIKLQPNSGMILR